MLTLPRNLDKHFRGSVARDNNKNSEIEKPNERGISKAVVNDDYLF